jgi:hypothetical protein
MKVFICHSSLDRWVARRLSQDLVALGATTFLDEKDIQTGDSIDDTIHKHLKDADEMLILLSPAAMSSTWVLLEVGGARALEKRLVPILLHVGPNDLPSVISKGLARDLNDVDKYYDEVRSRLAGTPVPEVRKIQSSAASTAAVAASRERRTFKVGDVVRIPEQPQSQFVSPKGRVSWKDEMTEFAGRTATVTLVDDDRTVRLDVSINWWWAMDWLEPAT